MLCRGWSSGLNCAYCRLKSCIFIEVVVLWIIGRLKQKPIKKFQDYQTLKGTRLRNKAKPKYQGLAQYYHVTDFNYIPEALFIPGRHYHYKPA